MFFLASTAFTQWPGLHHDSALYSTPIVKSAALGIWEYDGFIHEFSFRGSSSFNYHGQLYQFVFGKVLRCASYESLFRWTAALNVLTYTVYLAFGWKSFRLCFPRLGPWLATGMAAVAALACLYLQGRPECLLSLLMIMPFLMHEWRVTAPFAKSAAYVTLGLTVVLSPIAGVLCVLGVIAWIALRHRDQWIREVILCGALSVSAALAVLLVACPVNPWQWMHNTFVAGDHATGLPSGVIPPNLGTFSSADLLDLALWNVFSLGAFGVLALALVRQRLWWLTLAYAVVLVFFMIPKTLSYSYFGFMPVIMAALVGREAGLLALPVRLRRLPVILASCFALCGAAGLFRAMLLALLFSCEGVSFEQTRATVRQLESTLDNNQEKIGFIWLARPSFVAFSKADHFMVTITVNVLADKKDPDLGAYETKFHRKVRYVLLPQLGHVAEPPPTLNEGMLVLESNGWTKRRARFLGLKLGGAMPGYQFALYRRKEAVSYQ
ncbi:MAG: hypothetical protein NTY01_07575 [Verrucomicrobia bacterium]|nr:hypothetical protein [Verrucomicrobiota bacterium]